MVTVVTINGNDIVLKTNRVAPLFMAMNKEQIDEVFKILSNEITNYAYSINSLSVGTDTYIGTIDGIIKKMSQKGMLEYKKMYECNRCGKLYESNENDGILTARGWVRFCPDCIEKYTEICPECGKRRLIGETVELVHEDGTIVQCCYKGMQERNYLYRCTNCRRAYKLNWEDEDELCPICRKTHVICPDCGCAYEKGSLIDGICSQCEKRRKVLNAIKSYSHKPRPIFKSLRNEPQPIEYMGMEWEMELQEDSTYKRRKNKMVEDEDWVSDDRHRFFAAELGELTKDWGYCKSDGSLKYGVEFVTHPISLKAWEQEYYSKLVVIKELMKKWGCKTKASTAGIHIHYSRGNLGALVEKRICWLMSQPKNHEFMRKFSHRNAENMQHWARQHSDWNNSIKSFEPDIEERYRIVNVCPADTIEFRCFGYTVDVDELMAYLHAVDSIVNYCRDHKNADIENANIVEVITYRNTEEMTKYLKKRRDLADVCSNM